MLIFLSYRRDDTEDIAGRIRDRLAIELGDDAVYFDAESIPLGVDFRTHISDTLSACDVALAIIGQHWLDIADDTGRRLDQPTDYVRVEIEAALKRDLRVIPVLVHGAAMPPAAALPETLTDLSYRNGITVRGGQHFHDDVARLARALQTTPVVAPSPSRDHHGGPPSDVVPDTAPTNPARGPDETRERQTRQARTAGPAIAAPPDEPVTEQAERSTAASPSIQDLRTAFNAALESADADGTAAAMHAGQALAAALEQSGDLTAAVNVLIRMVKLGTKRGGLPSGEAARHLGHVGDLQRKLGDHHSANNSYRDAIRFMELRHGSTEESIRARRKLGLTQYKLRNRREGKITLEAALDLGERNLGRDHPLVVKIRQDLERL